MRLSTGAHPNGWRNHQGPAHLVLRNGVEVSAWSEQGEAQAAMRAALAEEIESERGRLPANARPHLAVTEMTVSYAPGGLPMWSVEFALEETGGPRERLAD